MSLVQGGEAPVCFSKAVTDYIVYERVSSPANIDDIPDYAIQTSLREVSRCTKCTQQTEHASQRTLTIL